MYLIRTIAVTAAVSLGVAALGRRNMVRVAGHSMEPSLWQGDLLFTVPARSCMIRLGQIVVIDDPLQPDHDVIKRVHRIAGDRVDVRGDNPDASTDSRTWGLIDVGLITRIAVRRWPDVRSRLRVTRRW